MKKFALLVLVAMGITAVPRGVAQNAPLTPGELRELAKEKDTKLEELVNLEKETARALQWNTGTFFRRVYGDDFLGILPTGQVMDKRMWIEVVENSGIKYSVFIASDIKVRMFEETAIVTCLWTSKGFRGTQNFNRQSRVTHVYVYGQRGWQAVSSQETLLPGSDSMRFTPAKQTVNEQN